MNERPIPPLAPPAAPSAGEASAPAPASRFSPQGGRGGSERNALYLLLGLAVLSGAAVYLMQGNAGLLASLQGDLDILMLMIPRVLPGVLIGGFVTVLAPKGMIADWLGDRGGFKGYALATVAGLCTPGGPMLSFPIVVALRAAGAGIPALIAYVTAWSLLGVHRIVAWELPLFGGDFALIRFVCSLPFPILAGWLAALLMRRLPNL